jgi:hypothetical protein
MKIRTGYVSNSSSASFILKPDAYPDVFAIAEHMIGKRKWGTDASDIHKVQQARKRFDPNHPISFDTCNYRTYIAKFDNYVIYTCNDSEFHLAGKTNQPSPELIRELLALPEVNDVMLEDFERDCNPVTIWKALNYNLDKVHYFWYVDYGIVAKAVWQRKQICQRHSYVDPLLLESGELICPYCRFKNY